MYFSIYTRRGHLKDEHQKYLESFLNEWEKRCERRVVQQVFDDDDTYEAMTNLLDMTKVKSFDPLGL